MSAALAEFVTPHGSYASYCRRQAILSQRPISEKTFWAAQGMVRKAVDKLWADTSAAVIETIKTRGYLILVIDRAWAEAEGR